MYWGLAGSLVLKGQKGYVWHKGAFEISRGFRAIGGH